ncbi:hypothetical protein D3C71_1628570 [compost metagenome]
MVHLLGTTGDLANRHADEAADFLGRAGTALCQRPHLSRHHRKAPPLFTRAGSLHSGIERQQIGLEGNAFDHPHDLADARGRLLHLLHGGADILHGLAATPGDVAALRAFARDLGRRVRCLHHGAGELLHRGGGLFQAAGLRFGTGRQVQAAARDLRSRLGEVAHFGAHIAHHRAQVDLGLLQPLHQRPQRLRVVAPHGRHQVAG